MAKRHEVFPSRFLTAADLNGKAVTLTIDRAPLEPLKNKNREETKTVLYFRGTRKVLPLNRTNWDAVADITGEDDSENWPGHQIQVWPTTTSFGADVVDCIRIRAPEQGELKPVKARPAKAKPAEPKPALSDEMDDEIPF
jgi:hypothetical protein